MPIRAFLYDAAGADREVTATAELIAGLDERQLLWVDVTNAKEDEEEVRRIASLFSLTSESVESLLHPERRPRLDNYGRYFQFHINTVQEEGSGAYAVVELGFVLSRTVIITAHRKPVAFLDSFERRIKGDSKLGQLDATAFLASLLDWHITSYFRISEQLQAEIDTLDARALRLRHRRDLLYDMAQLRQRVGFVRRTLSPHREVYAAMARPDFQTVLGSGAVEHYGLLNDRLERAIEAIENARESLIGSFDMFTTQTALRTDEAMKALTLGSFVWFPAGVIVGIAALLLRPPVDPRHDAGFWEAIALIILIGVATLVVARWRRWL